MENSEKENLIIEERITKVNGDFHIKRYQKGKFLGKGGFAKVYVFTNLETNKPLAGKVMPKANLNRSRARQKLMTEIRLHKSLHHQNIVKFEHVFEDQENVYIMLELCSNQSMNDLLKRRKKLTEFEVQCYVIQVVEALRYLQSNRIIHRDLKLGNMFLSDKMQIKLGDFGLAAKLEFDGEKKRTVCGTPNYIAPEILDGNAGHSYEVDVWSLGVIMFTLICGKPPFETKDIKVTYKKIKECDYAFPDNAVISDSAKDLIQKILVRSPEKRPTLDEILLHPFINHGGPIPQLMPLSTLSCPPTQSFIKQFAATGTSQRIRIATDIEGETFDMMKSPKTNFVMTSIPTLNSARMPTFLKSPIGSELPTSFDFFKMTPKTTTASGTEKFQLGMKDLGLAGTIGNFGTLGTLMTEKNNGALSPKLRIVTDAIEEEQPQVVSKNKTPTQKEQNFYKEPNLPKQTLETPDVRIIKWYDYTTKYGMSYVLSNGAIGVFYNDKSKLVSQSNEHFTYIVRRPTDKQDVPTKYSFKDYPSDIHKKVLVYYKFKERFEAALKTTKYQDVFVYIKKWIKTKHAVFFRMNNHVLQVTFNDQTILLMNSSTKKLTFVDAKENVFICRMETASSSDNKELTKRLKYTEGVLQQIWTAKTDAPQNQDQGKDNHSKPLDTLFSERKDIPSTIISS